MTMEDPPAPAAEQVHAPATIPQKCGASLVRKYVLAPHMRDAEVWHWYQKAFASFWSVKEVDLSHDDRDWDTLKPEEQRFLKLILAFFASADGNVAEMPCCGSTPSLRAPRCGASTGSRP